MFQNGSVKIKRSDYHGTLFLNLPLAAVTDTYCANGITLIFVEQVRLLHSRILRGIRSANGGEAT